MVTSERSTLLTLDEQDAPQAILVLVGIGLTVADRAADGALRLLEGLGAICLWLAFTPCLASDGDGGGRLTIGQQILLPSDEQIRALHERYAPTRQAFDLVYTHCQIICAVAEHLLDEHPSPVNAALVRVGSLLHDIGFPELVSRFCSHHTAVGLTREDVLRHQLQLPVGDYAGRPGQVHQ